MESQLTTAMKLSVLTAKVKLNNGILMPLIGLGTHKVRGKELIHTVLDAALAAGYRAIDTASVYRNEEDIGSNLSELLPKYGLKREDIFITSKLGPKDQGSGRCREACLQSLSRLGLDYLDLFLIHWPGVQGMKPEDNRHKKLRQQSWSDMEALYKQGKVKAIGVSNYQQRHLVELLQHSRVTPAVLQTEHHPHLVQKDPLKFCQENGIHYQAYSSLGTSNDTNLLLSDPVIQEIGKRHQKLVAQILLRWAVQQSIGVLPKSTNPQHISENTDIFDFELSDDDLNKLSKLDNQRHYCWDSSRVL